MTSASDRLPNLPDEAVRTAFGHPLVRRRLPLCPEIELWLLGENIDLEACCRSLRDSEPPPYWAFCWGSGQALARYLLDHADLVKGRRVVDFGTGSGVIAVSAALAGAREVRAVDLDRGALRAVEINAELNGVEIRTSTEPPDDWEGLLASDVLYETSIRDWLLGLRREGRSIVISDPERPSAPPVGLEPVIRYASQTFPDADSPQRDAAIYHLS